MSEEIVAVKKSVSTSEIGIYCSVKGDDRQTKALVYNAINSPDERISDHINETLSVTDVVWEPVELVNEETGEYEVAPRTVLITADGKSYQAVSRGIFNAVQKLIAVFGEPTWADPIPVVVRQITTGKFKTNTLEVVL